MQGDRHMKRHYARQTRTASEHLRCEHLPFVAPASIRIKREFMVEAKVDYHEITGGVKHGDVLVSLKKDIF